MMSALLECLSCVLTWLETTRVRESADILVSYLIFPDRVKLLLSWLGVGVIARLDIIVLRGKAQIIFRRSGRCSLLIARRDGRLDSIETGLKIHSETARINGPKCLTPRKLNFLPNFPILFVLHIHIYLLSLLPEQTICILQSKMLRRIAILRHAEGQEGRAKEETDVIDKQ